MKPKELDTAAFLKLAKVDKTITLRRNLRADIANAIKNCMRQCPDVSEAHMALR